MRTTRLHPAELVLPVFVKEGLAEPEPIASMPGVVQHSLASLAKAAREAADDGLGGIMLFGVPPARDAIGSGADDPDGILNVGLRAVRDAVGDDLVVMADLCLDEFTDHGHCGVLDDRGRVDNDATLERYAAMGLAQYAAGAHVLGLSGMMDGQVGFVRAALDAAGHTDAVLLAYAAKYASAFYGPFRDAVESTLQGDRATYQQDPPATRARRCARCGSTSPRAPTSSWSSRRCPTSTSSGPLRRSVDVPVAAYQVSGEYAMLEAAAAAGGIDRERAMLETLTSIRRAGASILLTYYAHETARLLTG